MSNWYRAGTISLVNGSTTVTGTGTAWLDNIAESNGLKTPIGTEEIESVTSNTVLELVTPYSGPSVSNVAYSVIPTQGVAVSLVKKVVALLGTSGVVKDAYAAGQIAKTIDLNKRVPFLDLAATNGAQLVGASNGKTIQGWLDYLDSKIDRQERSIFSFMTDAQFQDVVTGTNVLDLKEVFVAAKAWAVALGRPACIVFPGYKYVASEFPSWNVNFLELRSIGMPEWKCTGSGVVLNVDAGNGGFVYGIKTGQFMLTGSSQTQTAFRIVKVAHSIFGRLRTRECIASGGTVLLGVLCTFDTFTCSMNIDPAMVTKPLVGLTIGMASGLNTTACLFRNIINEGLPQGTVFNNADWCVVESGTSEGCSIRGVLVQPGCRGIQIVNHSCEVNGSEDVLDFGRQTIIQGGYFTKVLRFSGSIKPKVTDAHVHSILLGTNVVAPVIEDNFYNAFPDHNGGAAGIISVPTDIVEPTVGNNFNVGTNTLDRFGIRRWMNPLPAMAGQTVGASPWTYTNATKYLQQIIVRGGTVQRIELVRGGVDTIVGGGGTALPTNNIFTLAPGDQLRLSWSGSPPPDFIRVPL